MKTKNNVLKTALRAALIFSALLVASFSQASETSHNNKSNPTSMNLIEQVSDNSMALENWMTDEAHFNMELEVVKDRPMEIEAWMTNDKLFDSALAALEPASDSEMEIESWMLEESNFIPKTNLEEKPANAKKIELWKVNDEKYGRRKFILTQVNDKQLRIEYWMLTNRYW